MHPNGGVYCFCLPHCGHDGPSRKSIGTVSTAVPGYACTQKRAGCSACPDAHVSFSLSLKSRSNRAIKFFPLRQRFLSPCRSTLPDSVCKIAGPCDFSTHDRRWSDLLTRNAYPLSFLLSHLIQQICPFIRCLWQGRASPHPFMAIAFFYIYIIIQPFLFF